MQDPGTEVLISADSHVMEDPSMWAHRLPAGLRDRAPDYRHLQGGNSFQAHPGGSDPAERLKEMAVDGVSAEVLYPTVALDQFGIDDPELQEACFQVYNSWLIEYCSHAPDRLVGVPCISLYNVDSAVRELKRCRAAGLRGALVWQIPPAQLSFATNHYERFWAAAQDLEMPVSLHILTGMRFRREA